MTKINPYHIVKEAKRTQIGAYGGYMPNYDGTPPTKPSLWVKDWYTPYELPFFNKYWVNFPSDYHAHLTEFSLPLIGALIGAYTGKGTFNKIKRGLVGALAGAGVHNVGTFFGLRDKIFRGLVNQNKPIAHIGDYHELEGRYREPTEEEKNTYWEQTPADPETFTYSIYD